MRRTTRTLLGIAAVSATAFALALPATAANAATPAAASATATASGYDYDEYWGPSYSKWAHDSRAKAHGRVWSHGDKVHVEGKLYDKHSPWWLCGYVQIKFEDEHGDEKTYWAKKCGSNGYKYFHAWEHDVETVQARVCYWNEKFHAKKYCGKWEYIYEADEHADY
ncbi:hypothetical protein HNP84_000079 [Thermocatellispora tengchongensis]|uniref:Secreted protein n=1 Tax=Thermocatellispora tengchongensis TaxID=1073253 RepID=A0A840NXK6_9ACTN|nr:hypothetical protein [Thermocatellispora tengchongensis]MBB5130391.1 hypothetical protein [Thermocatellispora tengchongensis]